jgi:acetoin utilization protein AcuC
MSSADARLPLVVFGPRSTDYDFGPEHPLTPRRFGPGIDLVRAVGADEGPWLAPDPATDEELFACHTPGYVATVRAFDDDPWQEPAAGIGPGDNPPFPGMHEAAAAVAGGSIRAMDAVLSGEAEHAFHPGGGLHHAMPARAGGFCIYNDPALAIARARAAGLRVMYVDLDVHHGDGVEAIHAADPGVLTISFHESGRYLFPGTGFVDDLGDGRAAGTIVNVPLEPGTAEDGWFGTVTTLLPELAAAFGPEVVVSQHGADTHAFDPLAHLRVTTTAMGRAARLVDGLAHRHAGGRWLATGGGGYGVYRVVPRVWSHVWLAAAHREAPSTLPRAWAERWSDEAARYAEVPLPTTLDDPPNAGRPISSDQADAESRSALTAAAVRTVVVPRLVQAAVERGWWAPDAPVPAPPTGDPAHVGPPTVISQVDQALFERLGLAPRVIAPLDPAAGRAIVVAALREPGVRVSVAVRGSIVVALALSATTDETGASDLVALGVAPENRGQGLATRLLAAHVADRRPGEDRIRARVTIGERDPVEPLDVGLRSTIARRLLESAGFVVEPVGGAVGRLDPLAINARLR